MLRYGEFNRVPRQDDWFWCPVCKTGFKRVTRDPASVDCSGCHTLVTHLGKGADGLRKLNQIKRKHIKVDVGLLRIVRGT